MAIQKTNDATNVGVGKPLATGAIFIAPAGTTLPTDASAELDAKFECMGYASEDGVVITEERDSEDITAWGGETVFTAQTAYKESFTFTPIEVNPVVARSLYGKDNVKVEAGKMTVTHNGAEMPECPMVIETVPNAKTMTRYVVPRAKLTEKGDITLDGSSPLGRECTFSALPDDKGNTMYEYSSITGLSVGA